jgi:GNAT superfamily N-acetyltransferase
MTIEQCSVRDILDSKELISEYASECSIPAIGPIEPQPYIYEAIEASGIMAAFMVRDEGRDVGFAVMLMPVLPHYGKKVATIESLFIAKDSRRSGAGRELMRAVEDHAKAAGCAGILYSAPVGGQLERLLEASKPYQRTNSVFFRKFD